ncbi:ABC transporter permease [Fodinicurvata sediminis]|uniref:ABC transporter permease n=1 Tax=Fodinicurvata sediminis TaxID=1121832 RepID=UPI0003B7146A|nr:ABC transporter permease [Fodinicurvata sediminis]
MSAIKERNVSGENYISKKRDSIFFRIIETALKSYECRVGLFIITSLLVIAIFYPWVIGDDGTTMNIQMRFTPPIPMEGSSWLHPFGTDQMGRDLLVRSLIGLQYSMIIGLSTVILMFVIGCAIGLIAGFKGGWVDTVLMRLTDAQLSIPMIILAITILGVSRPTIPAIIVVLALAGWPLYARVARSIAMSERNREYVRAARVIGASELRIMLLLIAPNVLPPIAFVAVLDIARIIIFEAILGFLGLGVQPPTPTFGNTIADARKYLMNAWWIATMPGLLLVISLTSINLVGASLERARNKIYGGSQ